MQIIFRYGDIQNTSIKSWTFDIWNIFLRHHNASCGIYFWKWSVFGPSYTYD